MKKFIALLLVLSLVFCAAALAEETQEAEQAAAAFAALPIEGTWQFIYAVSGESSVQLTQDVSDAYVYFDGEGNFRFYLKDAVDESGTYTDWEEENLSAYDYAYVMTTATGETMFCVLQAESAAPGGYYCDVMIYSTADSGYMFVGAKVSDGKVGE